MPQPLYIMFGAIYTVVCATALGRLLLRWLGLRLRRTEEHLLSFLAGSPLLSLLVFLACAMGWARKGVFLWLGILILALAWWRGALKPAGDPVPPVPNLWKAVLVAVFAVFGVLYVSNAMAPEWSPDGSSYHLGMVARYLREHRFSPVTTNMYTGLSQGVEMLYLFAFAFGRHSAAALVHCSFLFALPLLMLSYGRRFGVPAAGACGAILVFTSPVVGIDGTSAYVDVAAGTVVFAVFYLLRLWENEPDLRLLVPVGLLAGFAYSVKYTAAVMLPYALGFVIWKNRSRGAPLLRPLLVVSGCALLVMLPWLVKNWLWLGNPFSPFANALFPNPHVSPGFEQDYTAWLRHYDLKPLWAWPTAVTLHGQLTGVLGPVFLLAPLGLLALRTAHGRLLLVAAAVAGVPYFGNIGTRFLIPALPFLSLAMGLVFSQRRLVAPAVALVHAALCWPGVVARYSRPHNWQLSGIPWREALRIVPEEAFLASRKSDYAPVRLLDKIIPQDAKVFTFTPLPEAYTSREVIVGYQSTMGLVMRDALWAAIKPDRQPTWQLRFEFDPLPLRRVRVVQSALGESYWNVAELRVLGGGVELPRAPQWRLRSRPNPWYVQLAFDNNPVTSWTSAEALSPGMFLELDFGRAETIDTVLIEAGHGQDEIRLRLDGMDASGRWRELDAEPRLSDTAIGPGLRRLATAYLKAQGIRYMLIFENDWQASDFMMNSHHWVIRQLFEKNHARLYELQ
ncbi:MAG: ArnT family glycosyltransferase [Bryobacteraceae bacterium]